MEHRWNHDIPNKYFTDPRYNAALIRQGSDFSNGSSRSTDPYYSSYSARSYNNNSETLSYSSQLQQTGGNGHGHVGSNHYGESSHYPSSSYTSSSFSSSSTRRPPASIRHNSTSSSSSSSTNPNNPNTNRERFYCDDTTCHDKHGHRSSFSRRADLNRHYQSVHGPVLHNCPWPKCERRGERGFPRIDHLIEHRRGFHHEDLPKREVGR